MRILDLYIGRLTGNSASTTFITLVILVGVCMSCVHSFFEQVMGE